MKQKRSERDHVALRPAAEAEEVPVDLHAGIMIVMERTEDLSILVDLKSVTLGSVPGADPVFDLTVYAEGDHLLILFLVHGRISVSGSPHPAGPSNAVKRSGRKLHYL